MALFKLKKAKPEFLLEAQAAGLLFIKQLSAQKVGPRLPLEHISKLMEEGHLFYDKQPTPPPPKTEFTPRDLINNSVYREFPDAVVTLKLARSFAVLDGRNPQEAIRHCAGLLSKRVNNQKLRFTLLDMVVTKYPENHLKDIERTIKLMVQHLTDELGTTIYAESQEQLAQALSRPRKPQLSVVK